MAALKRALREPLLQFLLLGGVIFALDAGLRGTTSQDDHHYRIVVTQENLQALRSAFQAEQGRVPSDAELQARLQRWLDEQMLYREALALGLDRRDSIVQRQMVQKMRFLLTDAMPVPSPTEAQLQAWLDSHEEQYGQAPRLSFEQVFFRRGERAQLAQRLQQARTQLALSPEVFAGLGDVFPAGQVIEAADAEALRRDFGAGFAERLSGLPQGVWSEPVVSGLGLHLVRITARSDYRAARLTEVRERVASDWRSHQREQANAEAMRRLRRQFSIEYENPAGQGAG